MMPGKLISVGVGILLSTLGVVPSAALEGDVWGSAQECVEAHLNFKPSYRSAISPDEASSLVTYCEWAFKNKKSNFKALRSRVHWEFVFEAPSHQRDARMKGYFGQAK